MYIPPRGTQVCADPLLCPTAVYTVALVLPAPTTWRALGRDGDYINYMRLADRIVRMLSLRYDEGDLLVILDRGLASQPTGTADRWYALSVADFVRAFKLPVHEDDL